MSLSIKKKIYSVVGLVLPRGEEQISGPSALSKLKNPQNVHKKVQGVARNIQNCATTTLVGDWKRATLPPSSPSHSQRVTEQFPAFSCCIGFLSTKHTVFLIFWQIIFLLNRKLDSWQKYGRINA